MAVKTLSSFTVKLNGVPLTVIPDPTASEKEQGGLPSYSGTWEPLDSRLSFVDGTVPVFLRNFSKGGGYVERRDDEDDGGYAWGEDVLTHLVNGVVPSGRRVTSANNLGLATSVGAFPVQSELFNGHLWCLDDSTNAVIRYANADPSGTPVYDPALNSFGSATGSFAAGYLPKAMVVFADASSTPALYVSTYNTGTGATRIYQYTVAGGWTNAGGILGYRADKMAVVWWEGRNGAGALRLAIIDQSTSVMRICTLGSDPTAGASYTTPITVGNPSYGTRELVAAPQRIFTVKDDGIWDFNELRAWNLTPGWKDAAVNRLARGSLIVGDHLYAAKGNGLYRYPLELDGRPNRFPSNCGPGEYWQDGTPIRGYITAMCEHDGHLLAALFNPDNLKTYICRGIDSRLLEHPGRGPVTWYAAEQVLKATNAGDSVVVKHMRVGPPTSASTLLSGVSYLWMFTTTDTQPSGPHVAANLMYAPLPSGSGPMALQGSGGTFTHNPTARLYFTAQNWGDRNAGKGIVRIDAVSRRATATAYYEIYGRADADPTTITNDATWTFQGKVDQDSEHLVPDGIGGQEIALHARWTTPSPYTAPAVLHEVSPIAHVVREAPEVRTIWVVLERDHELVSGARDPRNPDSVFEAIVPLQTATTPIAYVDEKGAPREVFVGQGVKYHRAQIDGREFRTVMQLKLTVVV